MFFEKIKINEKDGPFFKKVFNTKNQTLSSYQVRPGANVVNKLQHGLWWWSACSPSTPTIRVQILQKPTICNVKFVFEKNKNKQKEAGLGPLFQQILAQFNHVKLNKIFLNGYCKSRDQFSPIRMLSLVSLKICGQ